MDKKLQVFISSTYEDLKSERKSAVEAILAAQHIPAGMELFAAGDESQLRTVERWISESDIFLLILGGRYGSIEPKSGNSYIQYEYEYAESKGIPVFAVILSEEFLKRKAMEDGIDKIYERKNPDKYDRFKNKVLSRMSKWCDNEDRIQIEIILALSNFKEDPYYNIFGWVPGAKMEKLDNELRYLKKCKDENEQLRAKIEALKESPGAALGINYLKAFERSGLESAFRIKIENPTRDIRVRELVEEEIAGPAKISFRLLASSGANYLNPEGKVWQAGLGRAIIDGKADFTIILESPFSAFAKTRALANKITHHQWQEKISIDHLLSLNKRSNVTICVTEHSVNCSLFFTGNAVLYDPYLWARRSEADRTENNFWVMEFRKQDNPDLNYECYNLLEGHFNFLLNTSISLKDFLGENNEHFIKNTEEFQKNMKSEIEKTYGKSY